MSQPLGRGGFAGSALSARRGAPAQCGAGRRLQGRERAIRRGLGQVGHVVLFDEVPVRVSSLTMRWMIRLSSRSSSATPGARASWNTGAPVLLRQHNIEDQHVLVGSAFALWFWLHYSPRL